MSANKPTASFGFRQVEPREKTSLVRGVFDSVAGSYDLMNDLMSAGLHRRWKAAMIRALNPQPGRHYLDLAGGTGDIAFRIQDALRKALGIRDQASGKERVLSQFPIPGPSLITVSDINFAMLEQGAIKAVNQLRQDDVQVQLRWLTANAESLPLESENADAVTIAFGLRNVTHRDKALNEMRRVLKPGGKFLCLEFSPDVLPPLQRAYDAYSFHLLPLLGEMVANDRDAYQYLAESIRTFAKPEQLRYEMEQAGFTHTSYRRMSGGIVALHEGWAVC